MRRRAIAGSATTTIPGIRMLALSAFGLLGAVGAHALVFGSGHQIGGGLHGQLVDLLFGAAAFTALAVLANALCGARLCVDGGATATALRSAIPSLRATILAAASWFALIESCERAHAMPILAIVPAIVAVCALLIGGAHVAVRALRAARLLIVGLFAAHAAPTQQPRRQAPQRLRARSLALRRHLFSRPPPVTA